MESLSDLVKSRRPMEPPQITALKKYVREVHDLEVAVLSTSRNYLIRVPNGILAQKLRTEVYAIKQACNLDKPLVIHIS